jgi:hypothetical protein
MIMAIDAQMRKNLKGGGTCDQKIRRRIIATVSSARAAVVRGMYMPFGGFRFLENNGQLTMRLNLVVGEAESSGLSLEKTLERVLIAPAAQNVVDS